METGFISNPGEAARLATRSHQEKLARAIFKGVDTYFSSYPPPGTVLAARSSEQSLEAISYKIKQGDTLSEIAERFQVSSRRIKEANALRTDTIRIGQVLEIPDMTRIKRLTPRLANQIAAGEVVERPASVIKELLENALDAGATRIDIALENGGVKRMLVRDNGEGVSADDLKLALERHATSKIQEQEDLEGISTLGFRGEALASIASVSKLTMTSNASDEKSGWRVRSEGESMRSALEPAAHLRGTTVDVEDLFYNTPARRKFLRTERTELSRIEDIVRKISLSHPAVQLQLTHQGKSLRQYASAMSMAEREFRVRQALGAAFIDAAMYFEEQKEGMTLSGWVATPVTPEARQINSIFSSTVEAFETRCSAMRSDRAITTCFTMVASPLM